MYTFESRLNDMLIVIGEVLVQAYKAELVSIGLKNSDLINQIDYIVKGDSVSITMPDYAKYVEQGRKPHVKRVPISALVTWIKKKRIATGSVNNLAWAIQRSIWMNGIQARPFQSDAQDNAAPEIERILTVNFSSVLDEEIKKLINY